MYAPSSEQDRSARVKTLADQLYRERYHYLSRIAIKNAANREDAEDSIDDAFASFLEKFDPDCEAPPLAWVTLSLKRACWAAYRRQHLDRRASQEAAPDSAESGFSVAAIPSTASGPEEAVERAEHVAEARERLAQLKPAERRALVLIAAGYSYKEIGAMSDWSHTKTNRSAAEGRAALRAAMSA